MPVRSRPSPGSILPVVLLVLAATSARAQSVASGRFDFLRLPPSASTAATAGTAVADAQRDLTELFYNPSLLTEELSGRAALAYLDHVGDARGATLAYAHHFDGVGTLGGGLRYLGYGTFDRRNGAGFKTGEFGADDLALTAAFSRSYTSRIRVGGAGHALISSVAGDRATALAFDLGASYRWPAARMTFQGAMTNAGRSVLKLGTVRSRLPLDVRATVSKRLEHVPVRFSVSGYELQAVEPDATRSAAEEVFRHVNLSVNLYLGSSVTVRAGYSPREHRAFSSGGRLDLAGLTTGLTIEVARIRFDYAYRSWSGFGGLHFLTLQSDIVP